MAAIRIQVVALALVLAAGTLPLRGESRPQAPAAAAQGAGDFAQWEKEAAAF